MRKLNLITKNYRTYLFCLLISFCLMIEQDVFSQIQPNKHGLGPSFGEGCFLPSSNVTAQAAACNFKNITYA